MVVVLSYGTVFDLFAPLFDVAWYPVQFVRGVRNESILILEDIAGTIQVISTFEANVLNYSLVEVIDVTVDSWYASLVGSVELVDGIPHLPLKS